MSKSDQKNDALASLVVDESQLTRVGKLVIGLSNPAIRAAFADCIKARCSTRSVSKVVETIATEAPQALPAFLARMPLVNQSGLRQQLEKGFDMPESGTADVDLSEPLDA